MLPEQANRELESAWLDWQNCAHAVFCEPIFPEESRYLVHRGRRQHRLFRTLSAVGIGSTVSLPAYTLTGDEWYAAMDKADAETDVALDAVY